MSEKKIIPKMEDFLHIPYIYIFIFQGMKDHRVMNENTRYLYIAYVLLTNTFVTEKYAILIIQNTCHIPKLSKPAKFCCFHVSTIKTMKKYYLSLL